MRQRLVHRRARQLLAGAILVALTAILGLVFAISWSPSPQSYRFQGVDVSAADGTTSTACMEALDWGYDFCAAATDCDPLEGAGGARLYVDSVQNQCYMTGETEFNGNIFSSKCLPITLAARGVKVDLWDAFIGDLLGLQLRDHGLRKRPRLVVLLARTLVRTLARALGLELELFAELILPRAAVLAGRLRGLRVLFAAAALAYPTLRC